MGFRQDMRVIYHMVFRRGDKADTHAARMESFYGAQARDYDDYRKRLLSGREEMYAALPVPRDGIWVDLGGGTGWNIENLAGSVDQIRNVYVVDLAESLLTVAADRFRQRGWDNVQTRLADATTFRPPEGQADVVTFSYSLTMIPDWFAAIDNALAMLKPGGYLGVVDFYVSRKFPEASRVRHGWLTRTLWPAWFAIDGVYPSSEHLPYLQYRFQAEDILESRGKIPYLPLVRMPWYHFIGRKPREAGAASTVRQAPPQDAF
jgi:S-adenosylmethionine-diacylgycerolhomoserine-N-methlytransferase